METRQKFFMIATWIMVVYLAVCVRGNYGEVKRLNNNQEILMSEIRSLQHDAVLLMGENLILYMKGLRMDRWHDSIFNPGGDGTVFYDHKNATGIDFDGSYWFDLYRFRPVDLEQGRQ